jgi:hypothetical protein
MKLLDLPQAKHFCVPSVATRAAVGRQSVGGYIESVPKSITLFEEGTKPFEIFQVNLLDAVERWLLYSLAHYRRAMDMLSPVSAPWAHVTLYYSSFFAANAILGMFGGWIGNAKAGNRVVEMERGTPANQAFRLHRRLASPNGAGGSHRAFWDFFYDAVAPIAAWAPANRSNALNPAGGDVAWQTLERNAVNYDPFSAWSASLLFQSDFRAAKLNSISGPLALQMGASEEIVGLALHFAKEIGLTNDALNGCGFNGTRLQVQRRLVTQGVPNLVTQSALGDLFEI